MKATKRICSLLVCISLLLGMVYLPAHVSAAETTYGKITLVDEDFSDITGLTFPAAGKVITPGQYVKLDGTSGTTVLDYDDMENEFVITRSYISLKEHTFDMRVSEGATVTFEMSTIFKSTESDGSIVDHSEFLSCTLKGNEFTVSAATGKTPITIQIPESVDTTKWNTYTVRVVRCSPYGGDYTVELLINGTIYLDGSSSSANRIQNQNQGNIKKNGFKFIVIGGPAEVDNFSIVGRERDWKTIRDELDVEIKKWLAFNSRNDKIAEDDFGAAGAQLGAKWTTEGNVTTVAEAGGNSTPYLRITQSGGLAPYFDYPYANINGGMIPLDQVTTYEFDASFAGGGELGLTLYGSRTFSDGNKAIRYLTCYIRPAIGDQPAGVYVKSGGELVLKVDLSDVDMDAWNHFAFELNLDGKQEVYCTVNGVRKGGNIGVNFLTYNETNSNLKKCQMWLSSAGPLGYVDVDNVKLHYTMWGEAPDFAADAVLSVTNMTDNGFDISWPAAANATSYDIYLDGVKKASTTETSYTFSGLAMKVYDVKVVAISANNPNVTDEISNVALLVGEGDIENFNTAFNEKVLYDDYIDLSKAPFSIGDKAVGVLEQYPTSYAVGTTEKDTAVVIYDAATKILHAVGVGSAKIVIGEQVYSIGVEPAPISLFMNIGHSIGQGAQGDGAESIVCEAGQVYSSHESQAVSMVKTHGVAGTLRSENQNLTLYSYEQLATMGIGGAAANRPNKIDALTAAGDGTTGSDSGIGYMWNKLTGEKVWVLNAAVGSTNQVFWMPDAEEYWAEHSDVDKDMLDLNVTEEFRMYMYGSMYGHSVDLFQKAQTVLTNEIAAGHYTLSHMGIIAFTAANGDEWRNRTEAADMFTTMWAGYQEDLAMDMDGDGVAETVESIGIMPANHLKQGDPYNGGEIWINYTKTVNYYMAASEEYPDVYMAALDNRQWVTSEGVKAYFADYDIDFTIQNGNPVVRPTTVDELFPMHKNDYVHYQQLGYNFMGIEIAKRTYQYYNGDKGTDDITIVYAAKNYEFRNEPLVDLAENGPVKLDKNAVYRYAVLMAPGGVTIEASGAISLDAAEPWQVRAAATDGVGYLTVKDGDTVLKTVVFLVGNAVLEHTCAPGDVVIENETDSTCETAGTYDEVTYCTECGEELSREQKTKELAACKPGQTVIENETDSTCKVAGTYDEVVYCTECEKELSRETKQKELAECIPAEKVIENETFSTCEQVGTYDEVIYCSVCEKELSRETKEKALAGHTSGNTVYENEVEASCTAAGSYDEVVYCSVCGEELSRNTVEVEKLPHIVGPIKIENEVKATCKAPGSYDKVAYCSCGHEIERVSFTEDQLPHTDGEPAIENETESTCKVAGTYEEVVKCTVCGEELSRTQKTKELAECIPGEATIENETDSTCKVAGTYEEVVKCTVCGEELSRTQHTKELAEHIEGEAKIENETESTCKVPGTYEEAIYCTECGDELYRETKQKELVQHTEGEVVIENDTESTCKVAGSYDEVVYCAVCGDELSRKTTYNELKDHIYDDENDATCNVCGDIRYMKPVISVVGGKINAELPSAQDTFNKVVVFYVGEGESYLPWNELVAAGKEYPAVNGKNGYKYYTDINALPELTVGGNYVVYLRYDGANGANSVRVDVTVDGTPYFDEPSVGVDENNKIFVEMPDTSETFDKVIVFYVGDEAFDSDIWADQVAAGKLYQDINGTNGFKVYRNVSKLPELADPGKYVVYLRYIDEQGNTKDVCQMITIGE